MREAMMETLASLDYSEETAPKATAAVAAAAREKLKGPLAPAPRNPVNERGQGAGLELERYKYIVQVFIGEQKGEGAK